MLTNYRKDRYRKLSKTAKKMYGSVQYNGGETLMRIKINILKRIKIINYIEFRSSCIGKR